VGGPALRSGGGLPGVVPRRRFSALEAVAAVDRLAGGRVERNFGGLATLGTGGRVELAWRPRRSVVVAGAVPTTATIPASRTGASAGSLRLAGLAALRTTLRLGESALGVKVLLASGEDEFLSTIATGQRTISHPSPNLSRRKDFAACS
jgi:hypothetical protein